jgi:hypothetical protein
MAPPDFKPDAVKDRAMDEASKQDRTLTDADVNAIVERFQSVVTKQFYSDVGRGVVAACKRALIVVLIGFAAYGSWKGIK